MSAITSSNALKLKEVVDHSQETVRMHIETVKSFTSTIRIASPLNNLWKMQSQEFRADYKSIIANLKQVPKNHSLYLKTQQALAFHQIYTKKSYVKAEKISPPPSMLSFENLCGAYDFLKLSKTQLSSERYQEALSKFAEGSSSAFNYINPQIRGEAHYLRAICYAMLKQYDEAIIQFTKVTDGHALYSQAQLRLAVCYIEKKKYHEALRACTEALKYPRLLSERGMQEIFANIGMSCFSLGKYLQAISFYKKIQPTTVSRYSEAILILGKSYFALKRWDQALIHYRQALQYPDKEQLARRRLAECELAKQECQENVKKDDNTDLKDPLLMGQSYQQLEFFDQALTCYSDAYRLTSESAEQEKILLNIAACRIAHAQDLAEKGQIQKAKSVLELVPKNHPDFVAAERIINDIEQLLGTKEQPLLIFSS